MKIELYTLSSALHDAQTINQESKIFLEEIEDSANCTFEFKGNDFCNYNQANLPVIFIQTGGTEALFKQVLYQINGYVRLLTSGKSNSLAASMEILSFLKSIGREGEIIHGNSHYIAERLRINYATESARKALQKTRLGVIGAPSDWLIASAADYQTVKNKTGIELVDIDIVELLNHYNNLDPSSELWKNICQSQMSSHFDSHAPSKLFPAKEGSFKIYASLKLILEEYKLNGFTLRCFDLLDILQNTGCLSMATFNAQGIPACCEGDIPALLTMTIGHALTGCCGFQANPSKIDPVNEEITLAHCTVPLNMVHKFSYDTHFESGIGIAVKGEFEEGPVTIAKVSGDLSRTCFKEGTLLRNQSDRHLCRTQIIIKADQLAEYFLNDPIGNHHIIFPGHCKKLFETYMKGII